MSRPHPPIILFGKFKHYICYHSDTGAFNGQNHGTVFLSMHTVEVADNLVDERNCRCVSLCQFCTVIVGYVLYNSVANPYWRCIVHAYL